MVPTSRPNPRAHRATLIIKGYTVHAFAKAHGFNPRTVKAAIRGERHGPVSRSILAAIKSARHLK